MTTHEKTEDVRAYLPWYVNGTLDESTKQEVETAIAASPALKAEAEWLKSLQSELKSDKMLTDVSTEIGIDRFNALVKNDQQGKVISMPSRWQQWQRPLMAIAATVIVVQMGVIGTLIQPEQTGTALTTLSGSTITIDQGTLLQVTFSESSTELDIRNALNKVQGEIVAGPGAMGIYTILVNTENATNVMKQLNAQTGVDSVNQLDNE